MPKLPVALLLALLLTETSSKSATESTREILFSRSKRFVKIPLPVCAASSPLLCLVQLSQFVSFRVLDIYDRVNGRNDEMRRTELEVARLEPRRARAMLRKAEELMELQRERVEAEDELRQRRRDREMRRLKKKEEEMEDKKKKEEMEDKKKKEERGLE